MLEHLVLCVHSGSAVCLLNPAARDNDAEPSCVTAEADDKGVRSGDVSLGRTVEGNRAYVSPTHDAARRVIEPHCSEHQSQGPDCI